MPLSLTDRSAGITPPGTADLDSLLGAAVEAAEIAGAFLHERASGRADFQRKGRDGDLVSNLDKGAEKLIIDCLRTRCPEIPILAEESGLHEARESAWLWLVDPLDGTHNLAIGLPAYVVGVALCHRGLPVVGVVHEPGTRQTWSAVAGGGATGPRGRLSLRPPGRGRAVVAWTQGYQVQRSDARAGSLKMFLEREAQRTLPLWAPLLGWIMLARGDIDGFIGYRPGLFDLPGGLLIAQEAGVEIRSLDGSAYTVRMDGQGMDGSDHSFVAARPDRLPALIDLAARAADLAPRLAELVD